MGAGLLYKDLVKMEGAQVTMKVGHKKKTLSGELQSVNLHKEGLFLMLKLDNGQHKLLTPHDKLHDIQFTPQTHEKTAGESIREITGDNGTF